MSQSTRNVLFLPPNRIGRDFIIGDVCGCFDMVFQSMREFDFSPERDRLFSLGHLIHPDASLTDCVRFLNYPSVYAVRTNGEQDLLELYNEGEPDDEAIASLAALEFQGLGWLAAASPAQRRQLVDVARMLPIAISVGEQRAQVGFVHAGIPNGGSWRQFCSRLCHDDEESIQIALRGAPTSGKALDDVENVFVCYTPLCEQEAGQSNVSSVLPDPVLVPLQAAIADAAIVNH